MEVRSFEARAGFAPATCRLIDALKDGKPGDSMTDAELADICGLPCKPKAKGYSYLMSAIRYCEKDGVFWKRIKAGNELRCLDAGEKLNVCEGDRKHISRVARRSVRRLGSIDVKELPADKMKQYHTQIAQAGTMALFADSKTTRKIASETEKQPIDRDKVIELFTKGNKDSTT